MEKGSGLVLTGARIGSSRLAVFFLFDCLFMLSRLSKKVYAGRLSRMVKPMRCPVRRGGGEEGFRCAVQISRGA
jgi:hypothetical protein